MKSSSTNCTNNQPHTTPPNLFRFRTSIESTWNTQKKTRGRVIINLSMAMSIKEICIDTIQPTQLSLGSGLRQTLIRVTMGPLQHNLGKRNRYSLHLPFASKSTPSTLDTTLAFLELDRSLCNLQALSSTATSSRQICPSSSLVANQRLHGNA